MKTPKPEIDQLQPQVPQPKRGRNLNSFVAGGITMLLLGVGGFLFYQALDLGQGNSRLNLLNRNIQNGTPPVATPTPTPSVSVASNPYIQSALGNKAQVELVSAKRIEGTADEVNVEVRINRVAENVTTTDMINLGATTARNPVTNQVYKSIEPAKRSSGITNLFTVRTGQPADGFVVLKIPAGVTLVDISVENTGRFKNVLVAEAEAAPSNSIPTATPKPGAIPPPPTPGNPAISPSGKAPAIQETIPIEPTKTPVFPSPKTTVIAPEASTPGEQTAPVAPKKESQGGTGENNQAQSSLRQKGAGNKAQVQLLGAERIANPRTGKQDVVIVEMRIQRLADNVSKSDAIAIPQTTAINPVSDTTYTAVRIANSTGSVSLANLEKGESIDAIVALRVPEGVRVIDINVPETARFQEVEISRPSVSD
jgi:hypothetical protein